VLLLRLHPSKTLLRPGEAVAAAREAPGAAEAVTGPIDVDAALAWRDFMVSGYSDEGQVRWLEENGIDLFRGHGRLAGPGAVEVGGATYTADHVVVSTGSEPFIPPIPGLRELDGVWTNREVTGLKELPRRMVVLARVRSGWRWPRRLPAWARRWRWSREWTTSSRVSRSPSATRSARRSRPTASS